MPWSDEFSVYQLEVNITDELTLAESSRPDDPVVESDCGWRQNPTDVKGYEARLRTLRGALEAVEGERTVQTEVVMESLTAVGIDRQEGPDVPR
jgi:hypothetical protein